jgi:hypothetical protein
MTPSALQACTAWLHSASLADLRAYATSGFRPGGTVDLRPAELRRIDADREFARRTHTRGARRA